MQFRAWFVIVGLLPLTFASCGVISKHPLSDEKTSVLDKRLLGTWTDVKKDSVNRVFAIGKKKRTKNTLEFVFIRLDKDNSAAIHRLPAYARRGKLDLLSIELKFKEGNKQYHLCKYDFPDSNTLSLQFLDPDVIGESIVQRELKGKAEILSYDEVIPADPKKRAVKRERDDRSRDESKENIRYRNVGLTDSPKKIIEYLEKNASTCFKRKIVYKTIGKRVE